MRWVRGPRTGVAYFAHPRSQKVRGATRIRRSGVVVSPDVIGAARDIPCAEGGWCRRGGGSTVSPLVTSGRGGPRWCPESGSSVAAHPEASRSAFRRRRPVSRRRCQSELAMRQLDSARPELTSGGPDSRRTRSGTRPTRGRRTCANGPDLPVLTVGGMPYSKVVIAPISREGGSFR